MGQSASGIACDITGGKFGPFEDQLFVGDQTTAPSCACVLEKVNGRYQGACFPFRQGFASGNVPMLLAPDGSLFVGGTNRGWGSRGPQPFALERLVWTGKVPVRDPRDEGQARRLRADLHQAGRQGDAPATPTSYTMSTFTYIYQAEYGSPEVDQTTPNDHVGHGQRGRHERAARGRRDEDRQHPRAEDAGSASRRKDSSKALLHPIAWYTLWNIPKK